MGGTVALLTQTLIGTQVVREAFLEKAMSNLRPKGWAGCSHLNGQWEGGQEGTGRNYECSKHREWKVQRERE